MRTAWTPWELRENAIDTPYKRGGYAVRTPWTQWELCGNAMGYHCDCTTISRRGCGVPAALIKFSRRHHGVPSALLLERRLMAFVLSMSKRNADPWRSRIFRGVRWSSQRVATASMEFSRRSPWRSAFL